MINKIVSGLICNSCSCSCSRHCRVSAGARSRSVEDFVQTGGCLCFPQFLWFLCLYNQQSVIECIRASGQQLHHYYTVCAGGLTYYNLHTVCVLEGVGGVPLSLYTHHLPATSPLPS